MEQAAVGYGTADLLLLVVEHTFYTPTANTRINQTPVLIKPDVLSLKQFKIVLKEILQKTLKTHC